MREIGGYLEFEKYQGDEYHENCLALNSGRNCLRYLIRSKKIKKIALPKYNCSAIYNVCVQEKVSVIFYSIDSMFKPILSEDLIKDAVLYVINFFGQLTVDDIKTLHTLYKYIIVDNAQAFFTKPILNIDTLYTCRKFFGVTDGGYLYTDAPTIRLSNDVSYDRLEYIFGRFENTANEFYSLFARNEELIDHLPLKKMSAITHNFLRSINYEGVKNKRNTNFKMLANKLNSLNMLNVKNVEGPYMYPFLVKDGALIKSELQKRAIYIPTLWPNVLKDVGCNEYEYFLANNIIPLPCDQRYLEEDILYIIETIINIMED